MLRHQFLAFILAAGAPSAFAQERNIQDMINAIVLWQTLLNIPGPHYNNIVEAKLIPAALPEKHRYNRSKAGRSWHEVVKNIPKNLIQQPQYRTKK